MFIQFKRVLKFGFQGLMRNKGLSLQVVFIIVVAVFTWTALFFFSVVGSEAIKVVQKKIDIAVYFKQDISEQDIFEVRDQLKKLSAQIETVDYISQDQAMQDFLSAHQEDTFYTMALEEVEGNPFLASLNIKAKEPGQYSQISSFLEGDMFSSLIEKISYSKNKEVIEKVFSIIANVKNAGFILGLLLAILVVLITFNTVRLSILSSKDEISTMRLVGASNWFIRGPFLAQAIIFALTSVVIVDLCFFGGFLAFNQQLGDIFFGLDFLAYFSQNALIIIALQILLASLLGIFSTGFAVRKYLKV